MIRDRLSLFLLLLYVFVIAAGGYAGYRLWTISRAMAALPDTALGQFQGPAEAEKIIVEFLDYRCPACRGVDPVMREVLERNPDVKIVYRHFPVFGRPSVIEAEVALAAGMQGRFAEAHNRLINREQPITEAEIDALAISLGLDLEKFRRDMKGPETGQWLLDTIDMTLALGINSTPTLIIGDIIFPLPEEEIITAETIEKLLAEAYGP